MNKVVYHLIETKNNLQKQKDGYMRKSILSAQIQKFIITQFKKDSKTSIIELFYQRIVYPSLNFKANYI